MKKTIINWEELVAFIKANKKKGDLIIKAKSIYGKAYKDKNEIKDIYNITIEVKE